MKKIILIIFFLTFSHLKSDEVTKLHIEIYKNPQDHRDGSRSFYCYDPDKNILQFLWHPIMNK